MLNRVDQPVRLEATERLRALIADGKYVAGDKLPPERQLIDLLEVSRGALRQALEQLERDGTIWRHVGKGTFITNSPIVPTDLLSGLAHQMTPMRMMRARLCIEPAIAREAAMHASGEAVSRISGAVERAQAAASWAEYERQDDQLHRAVAEASDNLLLVALYDNLNRVQRDVAWGAVTRTSSRPPKDHSSFSEHAAILKAIESRDQDAAYLAMRSHLRSVAVRLFGEA